MPGLTEVRAPEWQVGGMPGNDIRGNRGGMMPCGHWEDWEVILLL